MCFTKDQLIAIEQHEAEIEAQAEEKQEHRTWYVSCYYMMTLFSF